MCVNVYVFVYICVCMYMFVYMCTYVRVYVGICIIQRIFFSVIYFTYFLAICMKIQCRNIILKDYAHVSRAYGYTYNLRSRESENALIVTHLWNTLLVHIYLI